MRIRQLRLPICGWRRTMKKEHFFASLFFALVILSFYLFYRLLAPFLIPICWAAILVIIFNPFYTRLCNRVRRPNLCALIATTAIVLLIIAPAAYLGIALIQEAMGMFDQFRQWVDSGQMDNLLNIKNSPFYLMMQDKLSPYADLSQLDLKVIIGNSLKSMSKVALSQTTQILTNTGRVLFQFGMMIFFMFFLFRDGENLFDQIKDIIPMGKQRADATVAHLKRVIESTMYGGVVVSLIQGLLGGLLFVIFGLPSPVFWGAFMAFLAFIPIVGPFLVYIPAGMILMATGSMIKGILLIAIGIVAVSQLDNFLRPLLVSGKTGMHTMLLFISIMGGINMFGLLGIVLGPFIAAVFVSIFDIVRFKLHETDEFFVLQPSDPSPPPEDNAAE